MFLFYSSEIPFMLNEISVKVELVRQTLNR